MTTVNPIQSTTYKLVASNNVITFGGGTNISCNLMNGMAVYGCTGTPWAVTNQGFLSNIGPGGDGLVLGAGSLANQGGATINASFIAVYVSGTGAAVANAGKITGEQGVVLGISGSVTNQTGGIISGLGTDGLGVSLRTGGTLTNQAGASITGTRDAVYAVGPSEVVLNAGAISGVGATGIGVYVQKGGAVTNQASGVISGALTGVEIDASVSYANTLANSGKITGAEGVTVKGAGGTISNASGAFISGTVAGVDLMGSSASLTNNGTISGAFGVLTSHAGANVANAGVITGTTDSVEFTGKGTNTLTLQTGSVLNGAAVGSTAVGARNDLVLQGKGTAANNFTNFGTLNVNAGGAWVLDGVSTIGAATISGVLQVGDATHSGAKLTITGGLTNKGTLVVAGGVVDVAGALSGPGSVSIAGGTAEFDTGSQASVGFVGATGMLKLVQSQSYTGKVSGLSQTKATQIDLSDIGFVSAGEATFSGTSAGGTLTVTDGTHSAKIALLGNYMASTFVAQSDGHGGTIVYDPPSHHASSGLISPRGH